MHFNPVSLKKIPTALDEQRSFILVIKTLLKEKPENANY